MKPELVFYPHAELDGATERALIELAAKAAAPKSIASTWTDHDGAGCPVSDIARVQVQFRADRDRRAAVRNNHPDGEPAHTFGGWTHDGSATDIVAYRVTA